MGRICTILNSYMINTYRVGRHQRHALLRLPRRHEPHPEPQLPRGAPAVPGGPVHGAGAARLRADVPVPHLPRRPARRRQRPREPLPGLRRRVAYGVPGTLIVQVLIYT